LRIRYTMISAVAEKEVIDADFDDFTVDICPMIWSPDDDVVLETPETVAETPDWTKDHRAC